MTEQQPRSRIEPRPQTAILFVTCLVDQFRPEVAEAVVDVITGEGIEVDVPREQTCCGQPAFNSGFRKEAHEVAARFLDVFDSESGQPIVAPSGSCAAMVRNYYPILFRDDPDQLESVERVSNRLWEFTEFLADGIGTEVPSKTSTSRASSGNVSVGPDFGKSEDATPDDSRPVTYHRCCHALRELGLDHQPEQLMKSVPDLNLVPLERAEVCCGFGGAFSVKMSDISTAVLNEKLDNVEASGAETLVAGDTGCIMHMEGGLRRRASNIRIVHIAQLLAESRKSACQSQGTDAGH